MMCRIIKKCKWVHLLAAFLMFSLLAATGAMAAESSTVSGLIEQTDQGIVMIAADNGDKYIVRGKDLSSMIGQHVMVTGTLSEEKSGKTLTITSVEPEKK